MLLDCLRIRARGIAGTTYCRLIGAATLGYCFFAFPEADLAAFGWPLRDGAIFAVCVCRRQLWVDETAQARVIVVKSLLLFAKLEVRR
jgi:hypothetical protein